MHSKNKKNTLEIKKLSIRLRGVFGFSQWIFCNYKVDL